MRACVRVGWLYLRAGVGVGARTRPPPCASQMLLSACSSASAALTFCSHPSIFSSSVAMQARRSSEVSTPSRGKRTCVQCPSTSDDWPLPPRERRRRVRQVCVTSPNSSARHWRGACR
eukprot:3542787-Pleurochrysis_carterae.AAC.6